MEVQEYFGNNSFSILAKTTEAQKENPAFLSVEKMRAVRRFHEGVPGYGITPLVRLDNLAEKLGVSRIYVKDESSRFGLNAFKGLGGVYAVSMAVCKKLVLPAEEISFTSLLVPAVKEKINNMVFITATDGNHGKGVAWAAASLGCKAYVYMPVGTVNSRVEAIKALGAEEVIVTNCNYDDTVRMANKRAEENGWLLIQDTAWEGYTEIPKSIIQGYTTMASEIVEQLQNDGIAAPSHLFLQAGVGAFAGGVLGYFANVFGDKLPITTIVEPKEVACIYESAKANDRLPHGASGTQKTIMAGLNCAEPCIVTWPVLRDFPSFYASCDDAIAKKGILRLGKPVENDNIVVSGESGAVTMGLLESLLESKDCAAMAERMGLNKDSVVVLISTEGATDPDNYDKIFNQHI